MVRTALAHRHPAGGRSDTEEPV
ncbi:protein of unknown function [Blastococcus saxobsidens DD2]|uniref:Uncharacterized protein n=1 Tax=Blastococcus saxobsidens (strain DD2) TaxID=1146883 RepID=H6RKU7_BLASD|nr:protein of unknown function [Blastococcus saxobsidens DD2]